MKFCFEVIFCERLCLFSLVRLKKIGFVEKQLSKIEAVSGGCVDSPNH